MYIVIIYSDKISYSTLAKVKTEEDLESLLVSLRRKYKSNDKVEQNQLAYIAILMSKYRIPIPKFITEKINCITHIYGSQKIITYSELMEYK